MLLRLSGELIIIKMSVFHHLYSLIDLLSISNICVLLRLSGELIIIKMSVFHHLYSLIDFAVNFQHLCAPKVEWRAHNNEKDECFFYHLYSLIDLLSISNTFPSISTPHHLFF